MAIKVNGTTVIDDSRNLQNVQGIKTVGGQSILGSGDIAAGSTPGELAIGQLWRSRTTGNSSYYYAIGTDGSTFVVGYRADTMFYSTDSGATWTATNSNISEYYRLRYGIVADGAGNWVTIGENSRTATSSNGISWTERSTPFTNDLYGLAAGANGKFVACGSSGAIMYSSNSGVSWSSASSGVSNALYSAAGDNSGNFVCCGSGGTVVTSSNNGSSWTTQTTYLSTQLNGVATDRSGTWVIVGNDGLILTSTNNGANWTERNSGTSSGLQKVATDGTYWVAVGQSGKICVTDDPTSVWNTYPVTPNGTSTYQGIATDGNGLWLASGQSGSIAST